MRNQISLTTTSLQQNCCSKCCSKAQLTLWNPHKYWVYSFTVFIVGIISVCSTYFYISARIPSYSCFWPICISPYLYVFVHGFVVNLLSIPVMLSVLIIYRFLLLWEIVHNTLAFKNCFKIQPTIYPAFGCASWSAGRLSRRAGTDCLRSNNNNNHLRMKLFLMLQYLIFRCIKKG